MFPPGRILIYTAVFDYKIASMPSNQPILMF